MARFFADGDGEIAHIAIHACHFTVSEELYVGVHAYRNHTWGQDAGGAVQRGEGFVELGHMPANRWLALHHVNRMTGVSDFQCGLDAGDSTAYDQGGFMDRHV